LSETAAMTMRSLKGAFTITERWLVIVPPMEFCEGLGLRIRQNLSQAKPSRTIKPSRPAASRPNLEDNACDWRRCALCVGGVNTAMATSTHLKRKYESESKASH
jgi:hypothetical protein